MVPLHHKSTHFWTLLIKSSLLFGLGLWFYFKIIQSDTNYYELFQTQIDISDLVLYRNIAILLLFTIFNWLLESIKWRQLTSAQATISLATSIKQTLVAHAAGLLTPAKLGALGIKPLFYNIAIQKQIALLHLFGEMLQMLATCLFGALGILITIHHFYPEQLSMTFIAALFIISIFFILLKKGAYFRRFTPQFIQKSILFIGKQDQRLRITIFLLSIFRYSVFAHQLYVLLWYFGVSPNYFQLMGLIGLYYLLSSILPVFQFLDIVVKSGVGILVFSLAGIPETTILSVTVIMWLFNTVLPLIPSTYLLFRFKAKAFPSFIKIAP